ncbi:MAG: SDR family oxidoreductase [Deltaproteobacteria bacterium]|nr:SDR family oxidoreductase [Deltaproteobacteria bacterium]
MKPMLADKTVLLTGASSGIGYELAQLLGRQGAHLALIARRKDRLEALQQKIKGEAAIFAGDISNPEFCQNVVALTVQKFGGLDIVINNAGQSMNALFVDTDLKVFHQLMQVNYFGSLYIAKFAIPYLKKNKGSLIFISSVVGKRGFPTRSGYCASKFAVQGLFESLRVELQSHGIHVGIISPGYTDTEIRKTALTADGRSADSEKSFVEKTAGKVMSAQEAAEQILQATLKKKREVILTSGGKLMVWLNNRMPSLVDKLIGRAVG